MDAPWFKARQKAAGVTSWDLGEALGRDRTIVARIYAGRQRMTLDQARIFARELKVPLAEVLERAGMGEAEAMSPQPPGFSEADARPLHRAAAACGNGDPDDRIADAMGRAAGMDVWQVSTSSMALAGILDGDMILVDSRTPERAKAGSTVIAQVYDWQAGTARTVLRQFQRPALVAHSANPEDWAAFIVDDNNVSIRGVVVGQWRRLNM